MSIDLNGKAVKDRLTVKKENQKTVYVFSKHCVRTESGNITI